MKRTIRSLAILVLFFSTISTFAQPVIVRIAKVDVANAELTIRNHGAVAVNVAGHYLCHSGVRTQIEDYSIVQGSYVIPWHDSLIIAFPLDVSGDLAYRTSAVVCDNSNALQHYVQWGAAGFFGEAAAVNASKWNAGEFLPTADRYCYHNSILITGTADWSIPIGIEENAVDLNFEIYPVPANDFVELRFDQFKQAMQLEIVNITGQTVNVLTVNSSPFQMDVSSLKSGIYFLRVEAADLEMGAVRRFIVR